MPRAVSSVPLFLTESERPATHSELKSYDIMLPCQRIRHTKVTSDNSIAIADGALKILFAYQRNRRQEFEEVDEPDEPGLDFLLHTVNYDLHYLSAPHRGWKWMCGLSGMYQKSVNEGTEFLIPAYHLFDYGLFATLSKEVGSVSLNAGLRFDQRHLSSKSLEEDGELRFLEFCRTFHGVAAGLGCAWQLTNGLNAKLNFSRGFRAPNISEFGSNGVHEGSLQYEMGNRDLDPEGSWQIDLGMDYSQRVVSAQLALFVSRIDHYIFSSRCADPMGNPLYADGVPLYQYTAGDARLWGGEARIDVHCPEHLHFGSAFSYVSSVLLHQPAETKYLPFTPAHRVDADVRYEFICNGQTFDDLFLKAQVQVSLRQDHFYALNATETATPAYALLGLSAGTNIRHHGRRILSLLVSASNLTDKAYQSHLSRLKYAPVNEATGRMGVFNMVFVNHIISITCTLNDRKVIA